MAEEIDRIIFDLQQHVQTADIRVTNLSTIARKGSDQLNAGAVLMLNEGKVEEGKMLIIRYHYRINRSSMKHDLKLVEQFLSESITIKSSDQSTSLKDRGSILSSQLYLASFWGFRDIVRRILEVAKDQEIPFNIDAQNKVSLWTPLHAAAFQEHGPIVMMLLEHGADPNSTDSHGRSPKDFASASDKLWGHFAMLGLKRTDRSSLVSLGILKQLGGDVTTSPPGSAALNSSRGIPLASFGESASNETTTYLQAASLGDVLANDEDNGMHLQRATQPQFSAYK